MSVRLAYLRSYGYVLDNGDIKHTKVSNFCLPMFGLAVKDFNKKLLNAYIDGENNFYVVVLNNKDDDKVEKLLIALSDNENFLESYDDDNGNELVFKLKIADKHLDDYHKILNGNYSEISNDYKALLTSDKYYKVTYYPLNEAPVIINGQVASTMWETLFPSIKKKEIVAKYYNVEISSVKELIAKPDLKYEFYRKAEELKIEDGYGHI